MNEQLTLLIDRLEKQRRLSTTEYEQLVLGFSPEIAEYAACKADAVRKKVYSNKVYIRGLIEISNICKNDCLYCGIRKSNEKCRRYRLEKMQILECCREGYSLGFRTFVLQGGEDGYFNDERLCEIISEIKSLYSDCAITLSLGERSRESYQKLFNAGTDRYLLRHETADEGHYSLLHPPELCLSARMNCLKNLKEIGFQTGCGFMVGSPYQTSYHIAKDLKFIEEFAPHMCGVGPFIPHNDTPFRENTAGSAELTCYLLSIIRLMHPKILLPATTALGSILKGGRELGIKSGANVVMPNLSPPSVRKDYQLYNNKLSDGEESAQCKKLLEEKMNSIGYNIVTDRGDAKK